MASSRNMPGPGEIRLARAVLGILMATAVGIFLAQFRSEPFLSGAGSTSERISTSDPGVSSEPIIPGIRASLPGSLIPSAPPERFDAQSLADKIDGKADLYLSAGFRKLQTQRVCFKGRPSRCAEIFVYEMESPKGAFAVYSQQRRTPVRKLDRVPFGYRTENALFAGGGSRYLEAVAGNLDSELLDALAETFRRFLRRENPLERIIPELSFFKRLDISPEHEVVLHLGMAFGYEGFFELYTAPWSKDEDSITLFLGRGKGEEDGARLAAKYADFLMRNGARPLPSENITPQATALDLWGLTEVIFPVGPYVAGIHEGEPREAVLKTAETYRKELRAWWRERSRGRQRAF